MSTPSNPLVSVLIPIYLSEGFLKQSIESILAQTYYNLEILCILDGPQPKCKKILLNQNDKRIKIFEKKHSGLIDTLNYGISLCSGEYIARMDSDDIAYPYRIEKQIKFLERNKNISAIGSGIRVFDSQGYEKKIIKTSNDLALENLFDVPIYHPTAVIRKKILIENNIKYNAKYPHAEDVKFWCDILKIGELSNIKEVLLDYRISEGQVSNIYKKRQSESAEKARLEYYHYLIDNKIATLPSLEKNYIKSYHDYYSLYKYISKDKKFRKYKRFFLLIKSNLKIKHKKRIILNIIKE